MGALILRGGRILLVERGREPSKGYWSLPGGGLETGETLEDGVRREVLEETGLRVKPVTVVKVFERITHDAEGRCEYHFVLIDYLCKVLGGALRPADDVSRAVWVRPDELRDYRLTDGTLPVIEEVFALARPSR